MKKFVLDAIEFVLIVLLLGSSYLGFFFVGALALLTYGFLFLSGCRSTARK